MTLSRSTLTEDELHKVNGTETMKRIIEDAVDSRHYLNTEYNVESAVNFINEYLIYDGLELIKIGLLYELQPKDCENFILSELSESLDSKKDEHVFILEQAGKCRQKVEDGDYDGAITNARSMVEGVMEDFLSRTRGESPRCDGDLNKLFKHVKNDLDLDVNSVGLDGTLKQTLSGLNSIVTGLAGLSNKMGDRHAREYKPEKHHAALAVNTAFTLCAFLLSSLDTQKKTTTTEN